MKTLTSKISSVLSSLAATAALALGASGCFVSGSASFEPGGYYEEPVPVETVIAEVSIDPGATMAATPGAGVGLFVQYDEGGHWMVFTTCDTDISGASCEFDILVSAVDSRTWIDNVEGFELEYDDSFTLGSDGSINLVTNTTYGMNGMLFDAEPGSAIEIDVLLDGVSQPQFVYVVSDGRLMQGVPTNPVDFEPAF